MVNTLFCACMLIVPVTSCRSPHSENVEGHLQSFFQPGSRLFLMAKQFQKVWKTQQGYILVEMFKYSL